MQRYEWGDAYMIIYLALDAPVTYNAGPDAQRSPYIHATDPSLEYLARIYAECRSGRLPAYPFVLMCNDSVIDPDRAPAGKAVMKMIVHNVPYEISGDATGKISGRTWERGEGALCRLSHRSPHQDLCAGSEGQHPQTGRAFTGRHGAADGERRPRHGDPWRLPALSAGLQRPLPELAHYRTPIPNVYLCGSGSHPGPGITMAPGRNAAQVMLRDLSA